VTLIGGIKQARKQAPQSYDAVGCH
jgi:hypothetical protein